MRPKKRNVRKGTFDVEVDGGKVPVKGKEIIKKGKNKSSYEFKAKGVGKDSPIKRITDKVVIKNEAVKKNKKKTVYKRVK